jgi:hypothetical protein
VPAVEELRSAVVPIQRVTTDLPRQGAVQVSSVDPGDLRAEPRPPQDLPFAFVGVRSADRKRDGEQARQRRNGENGDDGVELERTSPSRLIPQPGGFEGRAYELAQLGEESRFPLHSARGMDDPPYEQKRADYQAQRHRNLATVTSKPVVCGGDHLACPLGS